MNTLICVPITERTTERFLDAIFEARHKADAIELRLDYLNPESFREFIAVLKTRIDRIDRPLIMTFRPREQGGHRALSLRERREFWFGLPGEILKATTFADFELDLVESLIDTTPPLPWNKVIGSYHNFEETPGNLSEIYDRIARTPVGVIKIATQANRIGDCLGLLKLIDREDRTKPVIVLGMGMAGVMTRILALSRGALLTFGALRHGAESAPGQPTIDELNELYRVKELTRATGIFGVIGNPIGHSRSPLLHNKALKTHGLDGVYLPFEVDDLDEFIRDFVRPATSGIGWRLRGLSVTIPHKQAIMRHLDFIDEAARRIGAVNTVVVVGGRLHGYNTDVVGAMKPLDEIIDLCEARVAVLGAGGSARAICYGLNQRGAQVTVYARDPGKAAALAEQFSAATGTPESFEGEADLVINCTPIGMSGHSEGQSPIKSEQLRGVNMVYDLIYNPELTSLLRDAQAAGCRTLGGQAMLRCQAAEQFRLWTGIETTLNF